MLKTLMVSTLAMAMAVTVPLSAQQHQHGKEGNNDQAGMLMPEMGMMAMHQMSQPQPMMLLDVADQLELSAEQIKELQALQEGAKSAHQGHMQAAMEAHQHALEEGREDRQAYASAIGEAGSHMAMAHVAMTNAALDAKALLSVEQQSRLQMASRMSSMMQERMRGMCAGMMGSSGMPRGMQDGGGGQHPHN